MHRKDIYLKHIPRNAHWSELQIFVSSIFKMSIKWGMPKCLYSYYSDGELYKDFDVYRAFDNVQDLKV